MKQNELMSGINLPRGKFRSQRLIEFFQLASLRADEIVQPYYQKVFGSLGIPYFAFLRSPASTASTFSDGNDPKYQEFLKLVATAIETGVEISISLGEMGHHFMDNPLILSALKRAYADNNATIEILHGPHVDPKTEKVFELARQNILSLYNTRKYIPHHFVIIRHVDGTFSVFDENPHNEALWHLDKNGQIQNTYRSVYRVWYALLESPRYAAELKREFDRRRNLALKTNDHPGSLNDYKSPGFIVVFKTITNSRFRALAQPVAIISDQIISTSYQRWSVKIRLRSLAFFRFGVVLACIIITAIAVFRNRMPNSIDDRTHNVLPSIGTMTSIEINATQAHDHDLVETLNTIIDSASIDSGKLLQLRQLLILLNSLDKFYGPAGVEPFYPISTPDEVEPYLEKSIQNYTEDEAQRQLLRSVVLQFRERFEAGGQTFSTAHEALARIGQHFTMADAERQRAPTVTLFLTELRRSRGP